MRTSAARKVTSTCAILGLATIGAAIASKPAHAWWTGYGWGWGGYVPPVVVTPPPPPAYYPPPSYYYAPPSRVWVPAHWRGNYWVPGHWS
jgi:hypothetical protein